MFREEIFARSCHGGVAGIRNRAKTVGRVSVSRGKLGAAWENGQPVLLGEGLHAEVILRA